MDLFSRCQWLVFLFLSTTVWGASFKAGVARVKITPPTPFWLSGYAARTNQAAEVLQDLWAKALALEDAQGQRAVVVTMDLIGLPHDFSETVAGLVEKRYHLARQQLLLNCSHTHSGPMIRNNLEVLFDLNAGDLQHLTQYRDRLQDQLTGLIGEALKDLSPADISRGVGKAGFAINRRQPNPGGVRIGQNPEGPMDHSVPVLKIASPGGALRAVLFGYACHNTTLGGNSYRICGDYAGFAQAELERLHPGAMAQFVILCAADQNPNPRGTVEHATQYGRELAQGVETALNGSLAPLEPRLRTSFGWAQLDFAAHDRARFEREAASDNKYLARRAKLMLQAYAAGHPPRQLAYPVQAIRLGGEFTLLALAGEVVVDYALRIKREYGQENLAVLGYSHEVMCYIPSQRVLREGGYEPVDSMIYYGQPGPFSEHVEDQVMEAVGQVLSQVGVRRINQ